MGISGSPDIFQGKMLQLMMVLEYVKAYLDDLLDISKSTFMDHLEKLRPVLIKLQEAGLKVNAAKSKLCALETEYLGYSLSREGITTQTKKNRRNTCTKSTSKSKRVTNILRNGTILPRHVEKPKQNSRSID